MKGYAENAKESDVILAVREFLTVKKIPHWRMNSGAHENRHGQLVRYGAKGMADFYAIGPHGKSVWIECKRPHGGVVSGAQREFLDIIIQNGGIGIVVSSIESLELQLREAGVIQ